MIGDGSLGCLRTVDVIASRHDPIKASHGSFGKHSTLSPSITDNAVVIGQHRSGGILVSDCKFSAVVRQ